MKIKNTFYGLLCLAFSIVIGAAIYEHLVIWPKAYAAPPLSLSMFQGEYGIVASKFWSKIHPVLSSLFVICLLMSWKSVRRLYVLIPFIGYIIVVVFTGLYFVPELIDIITTPYSDQVDENLVKRGHLWEILSLIRLLALIIMVLYMFLGLTKDNIHKTT